MKENLVWKFSKKESKAIYLILLALFVVSLVNFRTSFRKSRDAQRKDDVRDISDALDKYADEQGPFPLSTDGKITACLPNDELIRDEDGKIVLGTCDWGMSSLEGYEKDLQGTYLARIPVDPQNDNKILYVYLSNGKRYQLLAYLEDDLQDEYNPEIEARNISCGVKICNFGKASGKTPLDKSIEEYENEVAREKFNN